MSEHTPGPWEWSIADKWALLLHQAGQTWVDNSILQCDRCGDCAEHDPTEGGEEFKCAWPSKADRALIAAAPDLLAACEAHEYVEKHKVFCGICTQDQLCERAVELIQRTNTRTRVAIAKAGGD